jgi:hypothetical protein
MKEENTDLKELAKPQGFRDKNNRIWIPKVTLFHIKQLEQRTGLGLFGAIFATLKVSKTDETQAAISIIENIFGSVWHLAFLVYISSEKMGDDGKEITFDEFCQVIDKPQFAPMLKVGLDSLLEFFPTKDEGEPVDPKKANPAE